MAASGGSITLRLAVAGSEEVKAALATLGPAGAKAMREIEQAQVGPTAGFKALNAVGGELTGTLQGLSGRAGLLGSALSAIGPMGLAAAAGLGALVAAGAKIGELAVKTAQWADGVRRFSELTGVSMKEVQEFDFIAQAAGIPVDKMRDSVKGLGEQIGKLQDNLARGQRSPQVRVFEGILGTDDAQATEAKLRQLGGVVPILQEIVGYAEKLSPTERLGIAQALKIDPEVLQSLIEVKGGLSGLTGEMQRYGLIVDDSVIKKSADAAEKMRIASTVIQGELRVAFVQLAPVAVTAAGGLIKVAGGIADVIKGAQEAITPIVHLIEALEKIPDGIRGAAVGAGWKPNGEGSPQVSGAVAGASAGIGALSLFGSFVGPLPMLLEMLREGGVAAGHGKGGPGGVAPASDPLQDFLNELKNQVDAGGNVKLPPNAGGGRGRRGAAEPKDQGDEVADHVREMLGRSDSDLLEARKAELTAQIAATKDEQLRAPLQAELYAIEDRQKDDEFSRREQANDQWLEELRHKKGVTAAELKIAEAAVKAANAAEEEARLRQSGVASQRDLNALAEKRKAAEEALAELTKAQQQASIDQLKAMLPLASTLDQRRALELQIFDAEEAQRESEFQRTIDNPDATASARLLAQTQLSGLVDSSLLRRQGVINQTAGPWDAELQKMAKDIPPITEEWQTLAADGVERFNADLFDSEGRVRNLGEVFRQVVTDMLKQLEAYLLRQAEVGMFGNGQPGAPGVGGLFNMLGSLFGGGTAAPVISAGMPAVSGISTAVDTLLPALPGLAGGGDVRGKGTGRSDSVLMYGSAGEKMMNIDAVQKWGPALDAMNAGRAIRIPHFAGGGQVGGGDLASFGGVTNVTQHIDASIHAPFADAPLLQHVAEQQKEMQRSFGAQWVAVAQVAGVMPKPRRR